MASSSGETPLHHPTAVYLIEKGANPNAATDQGFITLHYAAEKGLKKLIRMLISKCSEVDAKANFGTPLQKGQQPNLIFHHIFSPLVVSILAQSFECVKLLLQRKRKAREIFLMSKTKREDAFKRKDYINAIYWYTEDFERAADSFYDGLKLDPENKELHHAFCEAVFAQ